MVDAVLKEKSRAFNRVFAEANKQLEEVRIQLFSPVSRSQIKFLVSMQVFGLHAVECKKGTQQVYVVVNQLSSHTRDAVVSW